jgi:hypothetical protein
MQELVRTGYERFRNTFEQKNNPPVVLIVVNGATQMAVVLAARSLRNVNAGSAITRHPGAYMLPIIDAGCIGMRFS